MTSITDTTDKIPAMKTTNLADDSILSLGFIDLPFEQVRGGRAAEVRYSSV